MKKHFIARSNNLASRQRWDVNKGFTLAEILVVMTIVGIVGVIIVIIFANTLRGSNKSQILASIKQNGQAVLDSMDKTLRGGDYLICPSVTGTASNTAVIVKNGAYTRYRIVPPESSPLTVQAPTECTGTGNGCIMTDIPVKQSTETIQQFIADVCDSTDTMSSATSVQILTDTNPLTGVRIGNSSGLFTANRLAGYKASVVVNFVLKPGINIPDAIASQIDPVTFQTNVELR